MSLRFPGHVCKHCGDIEHSRRPNSQELETDGRTQGSVHYPQGHTDQTTQHQPHIDTLIAKSALREYVFMILGNSCATLLFVQGGDHQTIKDLVGHSSIGVTSAIYVDDAVDRLSQLFDPDNGTDTAT